MSDDPEEPQSGFGSCLLLLLMAGSFIALVILALGGTGRGGLLPPLVVWAFLWISLFLAWQFLKHLAGFGDPDAVYGCRIGFGCLLILLLGIASPFIAELFNQKWWVGPIAWVFLLYCMGRLCRN